MMYVRISVHAHMFTCKNVGVHLPVCFCGGQWVTSGVISDLLLHLIRVPILLPCFIPRANWPRAFRGPLCPPLICYRNPGIIDVHLLYLAFM